MANEKMLYAWARPLNNLPFLEHTWVTDYEPASLYTTLDEIETHKQNYWYCWGSFHHQTFRPIGSRDGNKSQSSCIATSNLAKGRTSHGSIYHYAFNGVCHQLANQVLYSTKTSNSEPLIVSEAKGYRISSYLYGTYGRPNSNWLILAHKCVKVASAYAGMDDFIDHLMSFDIGFIENAEMDALMALREDFAAGLRAISAIKPVMNDPNALTQHINMLINDTMSKAREILGYERYQMVFEHDPKTPAHLVDPQVMVGYFEESGGDFRPY